MKEFKEYCRKIARYSSATSLLYWDMETYMPKQAANYRAEVIGELSSYVFQLSISPEYERLLNEAKPENEIDEAILRVGRKEYEKYKKIPPELYSEAVKASTMCEHVWKDAKKNDDFKIVEPYFEKVVEIQREIAEKLGYEKDPYESLLDMFEPGMKPDQLRKILYDLRDFTVDFVKKVESKETTDIFNVSIDIERQKKFNEWILKQLGYNEEKGRLDVSAHPFTNQIGINDVRITTRYLENELLNSIYSTIHEYGHATFAYGIPEEYYGLPIGSSASMGFDESQSRFWENIVGRNKVFWQYIYDKFIELFPEFKGYSVDDLWKGANKVQRSFIRTEADEVTYNLHIIIRFEIEHALINKELKVSELPVVWNELYEKYLGIVPPKLSLGVLQDPHWYGGAFGYFPTYTLGNIYSAQLFYKLKKDIDFENSVLNGEFSKIREWMTENVHKFGKIYESTELMKKITDEEVNTDYIKKYLTEKFS